MKEMVPCCLENIKEFIVIRDLDRRFNYSQTNNQKS